MNDDKLRAQGVIVTYSEKARAAHENSRDIQIENLTMTYHGAPLILDSNLSLNYGNRYGFIGRNGCGKSTFMNVLGARCVPIPANIDIFHVKEEIEPTDMTALEAVMSVDAERAKLEADAELLNDLMAEVDPDGNETQQIVEQLNTIYERLESMDAATAEMRASKILSGLGFSPWKQGQPTKSFSGGWRMRVSLARALFIQPTLLLLDEPTNHLDMEAVVWLEDYLSKWDKILFMVSHSQDFMNTVCTHMVHLKDKTFTTYGGNYDTFCSTLSEKNEEQEKRFKQEQDQIQHMKDYVAKFGQGNAKMARQAQSKEKTLKKMVDGGLTDKVVKERPMDFKFQDCGTLSPPVLQCTDIAFGYPGHEILYSGVDFGLDLDSRVALVGPNGAGKSTLLKILTGELVPVAGMIRPHAHLRISKFTQHFIDVLDLDACPLDYFLKTFITMTREDARKWLGRYGVSGAVQTQIMGQLSDGQKSRVVLAKMAKENPHMLFLDEPTNHLDIESIDSLAKAINEFKGGLMLVSHDMRLISQVAKEIWMVDNKTVTKFVGEIGDFKMHLKAQLKYSGVIEGGGVKGPAPKVQFVPLAPLKTYGEKLDMKMAPKTVGADSDSAAKSGDSEMDAVRQARMEMAELAIKKQRARQAAAAAGNEYVEEKEEEDPADKEGKRVQKEAAKLEKLAASKAEKAAAAQWAADQEAILEVRRIEKDAEMAEAKKMAEEKKKEYDIWQAAKKEKDRVAAQKAAEEQARIQKILEERKKDRLARRLAREQRREEEERLAAEAAEARARADPWTQAQQDAFETALLTYTLAYEKEERWREVAAAVNAVACEAGGKSRNQCMARYKFIKDLIRQQRIIAESE